LVNRKEQKDNRNQTFSSEFTAIKSAMQLEFLNSPRRLATHGEAVISLILKSLIKILIENTEIDCNNIKISEVPGQIATRGTLLN